jgi:heme exporter protein CcmD
VNEAFDMGRYGFYVWGSYALFGAMLAWDLIVPRLRGRRVLRDIARRAQREAARKSA